MKSRNLQWLAVGLLLVATSALATNRFTRTISAHQLRHQLETFVQQAFAGTGIQYQLEFISPLTDWTVEQNVDSIAVSVAKSGTLRGNVVFHFQAYANGRLIRRRTLSARIRTFQPVVVLTADVPRGNPIPPGVLTEVQKETTFLNGEPISAKPSQSLFARRNLPAGKILTAQDVRQSLLIRRGENATLIFRQGVVEIKLIAKALRDAGYGETIWFILPDTRKRLQATVTGDHTAVIQSLTGEIIP